MRWYYYIIKVSSSSTISFVRMYMFVVWLRKVNNSKKFHYKILLSVPWRYNRTTLLGTYILGYFVVFSRDGGKFCHFFIFLIKYITRRRSLTTTKKIIHVSLSKIDKNDKFRWQNLFTACTVHCIWLVHKWGNNDSNFLAFFYVRNLHWKCLHLTFEDA